MRILVLAVTLLMTACTTNYISNFYGGDTDDGSGDTVMPADTDEAGDDSDAPLDTDVAEYGEAVLIASFLGPNGQGSIPYLLIGDSNWMGGVSLQVFGGRAVVDGLTMPAQARDGWGYAPVYPAYDLPPYFTTCKLFDDRDATVVAEGTPTGDSLTMKGRIVLENRDLRTFRIYCTAQKDWIWGGRSSMSFYFNKYYGAISTTVDVVFKDTNEGPFPLHMIRLPSTEFENGDTGSPAMDTDIAP